MRGEKIMPFLPLICRFFHFQTSCHETRKRKETELEMLTGKIEGWEEDVSEFIDYINIVIGQVCFHLTVFPGFHSHFCVLECEPLFSLK